MNPADGLKRANTDHGMDVRLVDPRDIGWESESMVFRVHFWKQAAAPPGTPHGLAGFESEEFEVRGAADVRDVLTWADTAAGTARTYTVYVVIADKAGESGIVRIAGVDPSTSGDR
jgi:hypothetical protein